MNGIHDMGGMHGFGPVEREVDEPVFHAAWEARLFAIRHAMGAWGKWNIDGSRYAREIIPPEAYLRMSYYERWLEGLVTQMIETGLVTADEVATARPASGTQRATPALAPNAVERVLSRSISRFSLTYRNEAGAWQEQWDGREAGGLPVAVRLELALAGLSRPAPAIVVALPLGKPAR